MSAPVSSSANSAASAISGGAGAKAVSLNPLGSPLFSSLLSMGLSNFTMSPTTPVEGGAEGGDVIVAAPAANTDAKSSAFAKNGFGLQQALLITPAELDAMSEEDLKSLLASFGDTTDELTPQILVALTPGVPATETFEAIKTKFAELGIDTSKFKSISLTPRHDYETNPGGPTPALGLTGADALTVDTMDAAQTVNFLLITTGFTPSEMGPIKEAIKAVSTGIPVEAGDAPETVLTDDADDANATAAAMVMMVYVVPTPKPVDVATAQELGLDLSALSAFTQMPIGQDTEEADWNKKLSDKLGTISLTDDASPFDDEMNAILAPHTSKATDTGFQGSLSTTTTDAQTKDADTTTTKAVNGEVSAQALAALNHGGALTSAALNHLNGDAMLMANGNMLNAQNMSSLSNPIFTSGSAIGAHPVIHAVATLIEKAASGSEKAKQELSVQLDPPELGRMQIQLSMEKDGVMKVHLLAESQETLSLLQRDSHALKAALDSAGIQTDNSSLTFDLASGDQSFNQLMGGQQDNQSSGNTSSRHVITVDGGVHDAADMAAMDTKMDFIPDKVTGNIHYSLLA